MLRKTSLPAGEAVSRKLRVLRHDARVQGHGRQHAHAFLHHGVEQWQAREVVHGGRRAAQDGVELVGEVRGDLGVLRQEQERPRERVGARLVPGGEDDAGVADEIVLVQSAAVLVARGDEGREHVGAAGGAPGAPTTRLRALVADDRDGLAVDLAREVQEAPVGQPGQVPPHHHGRRHHRHEPALHHLRQTQAAVPLLAAEERLGRDAQRELGHVGVDVADCAGAVALEDALGDADHVVAVRVDVRLVKRGHEQAAVAAVLVAVDVEEARHGAHQRPLARGGRARGREQAARQGDHLVALVLREHLAVQLRAVDDDDAGAGRGGEDAGAPARAGVDHADRGADDRGDAAVAEEQVTGAGDGIADEADHVARGADAPHRGGAGGGGDRGGGDWDGHRTGG